MRVPYPTTLLWVLACAGGSRAARQEPSVAANAASQLGRVEFPVSCASAARPAMDSGLALLHHMTYEAARQAFERAGAADPDCSMAYWGQAMTYIHPLWNDPPSAADFSRGRELIARSATAATRTAREDLFRLATEAYFAAGRQPSERANLVAFERGWARAHEELPEDVEATAFYALAHLGTADPADKTYAHQRAAGALMAELLARHPDHPGAHHYLIHAYDVPPLAQGALAAARHYGTLAPDVPHALHMPTHTFTRLGLWEESIAWNLRSAAAARSHPVGGAVSLHYLHALDYLAYAYLQTGQEKLAEGVQDTLAALRGPYMIEIATPYTFAAVPARLALERQQWAAAAALLPRIPADYPWDRFPAMEALTHFARALGAAHLEDTASARRSIARLHELRAAAGQDSPYWANQIGIQATAAAAWLAWATGDTARSLALSREAAKQEDATEKHPVTPGELLPARELLADLLLEAGRPAEARPEYEAVLRRSPGRLNSLNGLARSARLAADSAARGSSGASGT